MGIYIAWLVVTHSSEANYSLYKLRKSQATSEFLAAASVHL